MWLPGRYAGTVVHVIGGGPSLRGTDWERFRGLVCIATNCAGYDVPWADVLVFRDYAWWRAHRAMVEAFAGHVVTSSPYPPKRGRAEFMDFRRTDDFPPLPMLRGGRTTGHCAAGLAVAGGAAGVVLHGFDGHGRNYHDRYSDWPTDRVQARQNANWRGWNMQARARGCRIVNATPRSAIDEFPMVA